MAAKKAGNAKTNSNISSKTNAKASTSRTANVEAALRPVKDAHTKASLFTFIAEQTGLSRKDVGAVFTTLEEIMRGSLHPKGVGEFTLPGLLKIVLRKVPARKAGTMIRNPATGEMMAAAAKPASVRVKVRPLAKLKTAATG